MIKPTIGRVVEYSPAHDDVELKVRTHPAIITKVHSDISVNLTVFGAQGSVHGRQYVLMVQEDPKPEDGYEYACWMDYQQGQAAKSDALVATLTKALEGMTKRVDVLEAKTAAFVVPQAKVAGK